MKQTLERRLRRLEEKVGVKTTLKESEFSELEFIKFQGGTMRRFDRSDWSTFGGATPFKDGSEPFIAEDVNLKKSFVSLLEATFGVPFENTCSIIYDFTNSRYTISVSYYDSDFQSYEWSTQFLKFERGVDYIQRQLGRNINDSSVIDNLDVL